MEKESGAEILITHIPQVSQILATNKTVRARQARET
jgi:hypothetical protein